MEYETVVRPTAALAFPGFRLPAACVVLLAAIACVLPQDALAQQNPLESTLQGRVIDDGGEFGVVDAIVEFLDANGRVRARTSTDDSGAFALTRLPSGGFALRVTRLGYARTTTPYWQLASGEILAVTVRMHPRTIVLAPLEITARLRSGSPVLAGFYHRRDLRLGGTFFTREDIERRNPRLVSDLFLDLPGIEMGRGQGITSRTISFSRAGLGPGGGNCPAQVYVDGMLARGGKEGVVLDELASPSALEGIEVYRGLATLPAEFAGTPDARCGVIALWTRRGG